MKRGACPSLAAPMQTGDGLLARLVLTDALTAAQLAGLAVELLVADKVERLVARHFRVRIDSLDVDAIAAAGEVVRQIVAMELNIERNMPPQNSAMLERSR